MAGVRERAAEHRRPRGACVRPPGPLGQLRQREPGQLLGFGQLVQSHREAPQLGIPGTGHVRQTQPVPTGHGAARQLRSPRSLSKFSQPEALLSCEFLFCFAFQMFRIYRKMQGEQLAGLCPVPVVCVLSLRAVSCCIILYPFPWSVLCRYVLLSRVVLFCLVNAVLFRILSLAFSTLILTHPAFLVAGSTSVFAGRGARSA